MTTLHASQDAALRARPEVPKATQTTTTNLRPSTLDGWGAFDAIWQDAWRKSWPVTESEHFAQAELDLPNMPIMHDTSAR